MAIHHLHILLLLLLLRSIARINAVTPINLENSLHRTSFPDRFVFGTASSSYQYEGAARQGGRGPSIWDTFTHKYPEKIADGSNGDVAINHYHRYKEDVGIMKEMGLDAYRFSISWSRILPNGKLSGGVNLEGIAYYNNLIDEVLANGLQPYVTLFHWDLPQGLEDEYGGFLSPKIVADFRDYADLCFAVFGDRVKNWITLNEPWSYSDHGYAIGTFAPGRCSDWQQLNCTGGDSGVEPYIVSHHFLLAHAAAVRLYRQKYQATQKGVIGITLVTYWIVPFSEQSSDKDAAQRALDFMFGWFMDPITSGNYPQSMQSLVGDRLPKFSKRQSEMLKGSFDFLGLNYYTARYATDAPSCGHDRPSYRADACAMLSVERDGVPIGPATDVDWLYVYPRGFYELLVYIKNKYNNPIIYITENGVGELDKLATLSVEEALNDNMRIEYYDKHLSALRHAMKRQGVNVKGYFAWSLLDNFEWADGYSVRFGINYVDYEDRLKRYPKRSAYWFKNFLNTTATSATQSSDI